MSRAEMEICRARGANRWQRPWVGAELVTGIARAGVDPKRHDGRSLSQASVEVRFNVDGSRAAERSLG
jgi:hypothetical protein